MNVTVSRQLKLQESNTFFRLIRILKESIYLTQRDLAKKLGISVGALIYSLKALTENVGVKLKILFDSANKFGNGCFLTRTGIDEKAVNTHRLVQRKIDEYKACMAEIKTMMIEIVKATQKA
jgi:DNA-binding Lrp family transcriptional regulator